MVQVYIADITHLPDPKEHAELTYALPQERREKIMHFGQSQNRRQSLGAGLLLEQVLAEHGISANSVRIGKHGKPEVPGIHFNLSHSENLVVCAVSDKPVGCDVEKIKEVPHTLAERFFSEKEREYLSACSGEAYKEAFFRLWTMKESYAKMTGEGMSGTVDKVEIVLDEPIQILCGGQVQKCYIKEYRIDEYQISVCAEEEEFSAAYTMVQI